MKIAIAGATGFIGQNLMASILSDSNHEVVAMAPSIATTHEPRITVRRVDLYNYKDAEAGLAGCDMAFYLVHSMSPTSRLSRGTYEDLSYVLADNFARAAKHNNIGHVIYVGGIVPQYEGASRHLENRMEIETILASYGTPLTVLRCGLVLGPGSANLRMLVKLVRRLPVMLLPKWTETPCQPVFIDDLIETARRLIEAGPQLAGVYEVGPSEPYPYRRLIMETARVLKRRPLTVRLPFNAQAASKVWMRLVTWAPKRKVEPLVDSLATPFTLPQPHPPPSGLPSEWTNLYKALQKSIEKPAKKSALVRPISWTVSSDREVRSIERLPLPEGRDEVWVARAYMEFLPSLFSYIVKVHRVGETIEFYLKGMLAPLLLLTLARDRTGMDRPYFEVAGGFLARASHDGRIEFLLSVDRRFIISALHEYRPRKSWSIYRVGQAQFHRWAMTRFKKYLEEQSWSSSLNREVASVRA